MLTFSARSALVLLHDSTWDELLEHVGKLVEWGAGEVKGWHARQPSSFKSITWPFPSTPRGDACQQM